jgi:hypothetical protein
MSQAALPELLQRTGGARIALPVDSTFMLCVKDEPRAIAHICSRSPGSPHHRLAGMGMARPQLAPRRLCLDSRMLAAIHR